MLKKLEIAIAAGLAALFGGCGGGGTADETSDGGASGADAAGADAPPADAEDLVADRPYELLVPEDASDPAPLVVLLHGFSVTGEIQAEYFGILEVAEEQGFFVAYPDGLEDSSGWRFWNATDACCDFTDVGVDDVAYLSAVIDDVEANHAIDSERVFVVGHSNGAFMAHRLACERADRIAGIVTLAGATWDDPSRCVPSEPVPVLQVHGEDDGTILYEGGELAGVPYPSAATTVERWAELNGCTGELSSTGDRLNLVSLSSGSETRVERFDDCPGAGAVKLWTLEGTGHIPAFRTPEWPEAIMEFLHAHAAP